MPYIATALNDRAPVNPPSLTAAHPGDPWLVAALYGDGGDLQGGRVTACRAAEATPPIDLTGEPGYYGAPQTATDADERLWAVFTQGRDGLQRVILAGLDAQGRALGRLALTPWGRFERPGLAAMGDALWVAWECHEPTGTAIQAMRLTLADTLDDTAIPDNPIALTPAGGRAYRPLPVTDGRGGLYLVYECFHAGRYHLVAAVLDPASGAILSAADIGFTEYNDMEANVAAVDGRLIVAWENTRPLRKGDEMIGTTIPAFGHGWRFETRMGLRRMAFDGGRWQVENLGGAATPLVELDGNTSSGCPRVLTGGQGGLAIAWMAFARDRRGWSVHVRQWDGSNWGDDLEPGLTMRERVTPAMAWEAPAGRITLAGQEDPAGGLRLASLAAAPEKPASFAPAIGWRPFEPGQMIDTPAPRATIDHAGRTLGLYWGDLHMHSNLSICSLHSEFHCTELDNKYRFTRDAGAMDFAMVTDHDVMADRDWARTRHAADLADLPGGFVAFPGFEWTSSMQKDKHNFGHYCVLYLEDGPLLRISEDSSDTVGKLWAAIPAGRSLTIPHHPSDITHPLDWDYFNPGFEPLVEIFQVRGAYEYDGGPFDPATLGRGIVPGHSVRDGLARGYRFGFTSGGEHEGVGVTGVYAESLTRQGLFDALKKRHTFGTTGARFAIEFRVAGHLMGEECTASEKPRIQMKIKSESPIAGLRLVRDGQTIKEWDALGTDVALEWRDDSLTGPALASDHYYYIAATREDGEMAWASPVFLKGA